MKKVSNPVGNPTWVAVGILSLLSIVVGASERPTRHALTLDLADYPAQMKLIQENGIDVAGVDFPAKKADVIVDDQQLKFLKEHRFHIEAQKSEFVDQAVSLDPQYQTSVKVGAKLQDFARNFPNLAQVQSIGKSGEGHDIWAIRLTSTAGPAKKPTVLFNGMHHAREVMSTEVPLDIIDYLLTQYSKDARVTHWLDANEVWIVPMLNVDGNDKVWAQDHYWRKNTRGGYGVDINRNYPYAWNTCNGSSGSLQAQDYRGPQAGSEPETHVLMDLVAKIHPIFDISFHSYSELVIYPQGCPGQRAQNKEVVEGLGKAIAQLLPSDSGRSGSFYTAGTAWETLYAVDGDDIDWMYHEYQVIPYVIELNSSSQGFQPSYDKWRDKTTVKLRAAWQLLLDRMDGAAVQGEVMHETKAIPNSVVKVIRPATSKVPAFDQTYRVNTDGSFFVVLSPGKYSLSFEAPGFKNESQEVEIGKIALKLEPKLSKIQ